MSYNIIGAAVAAVTGLAVAFFNFALSKKVLVKAPERYSYITLVRQALQIGFLVLVYFVGTKTQLADPTYLLVGAVVGLTVPMLYFTKKLLSVNDSGKTDTIEKEGEKDG